MTSNIKLTLVICILLLFSACQVTKETSYLIDGGLILNESSTDITNVKITHLPTKKIVYFSAIYAHSKAELDFSKKKLLAHEAHIQWQEGANSYQQTISLPKFVHKSPPVTKKLKYIIFSGGRVSASILNNE